MSYDELMNSFSTGCDVGCKKNSKGNTEVWIGYKLHLDVVDGDIPVSSLLSSASVHDSQVAIPMAELTHRRITNCYDLMDATYVRIKGLKKVFAHLMFGVLALTADQFLRLVS